MQIVPVCTFCEHGGDTIYFNAALPISARGREKEDVLEELRDSLATMVWLSVERHSTPLNRAELTGDIHERFMWERCREYQRVKWYEDVWEEELTIYRDKRHPTPQMVRATLKDVKITKENAYIMAPILARIEEDERYDFKRFMHENWNRSPT
ncbi:MAG: hypothetical protein LIO45_00005 [Clostridiales bacterium]|nr:hypothetical protein [Clostridiales bacterium]